MLWAHNLLEAGWDSQRKDRQFTMQTVAYDQWREIHVVLEEAILRNPRTPEVTSGRQHFTLQHREVVWGAREAPPCSLGQIWDSLWLRMRRTCSRELFGRPPAETRLHADPRKSPRKFEKLYCEWGEIIIICNDFLLLLGLMLRPFTPATGDP